MQVQICALEKEKLSAYVGEKNINWQNKVVKEIVHTFASWKKEKERERLVDDLRRLLAA